MPQLIVARVREIIFFFLSGAKPNYKLELFLVLLSYIPNLRFNGVKVVPFDIYDHLLREVLWTNLIGWRVVLSIVEELFYVLISILSQYSNDLLPS